MFGIRFSFMFVISVSLSHEFNEYDSVAQRLKYGRALRNVQGST